MKEERSSIPPFLHSSIPPVKAGAPSACWHVLLLALVLGLTGALGLTGCAYYSFTAATIPQRIETIAIPLVEDASTSPFTDLSTELTDLFVNRFVQQTRLRLQNTEAEADAVLAARIEGYRNEPTAVGEEQAALNSVTISVAVQYYDQVEDEALLERVFTSSENYDPVQDGPDGAQAAAFAALENIADDVFSAATSDW